MGLLDDAIREHLDLKRRRGADPAAVARLEQEALGPVRREPAPAEAAAADPPAHAEPSANAPQPLDEGLRTEDATHAIPPEERRDPPHGDPLFEHPPAGEEPAEPAARPDAPEPEAAAPPPAPPAPADEAPDAEPVPDPRHSDIVHQPTTEFRVEDHHDEEDVLEETPDFLQETPEHDRLWFEQRPPRDFDFDG